MKKGTLKKLYLYLSWILLATTCLVAFLMKNPHLSMLGLVLSIAFKYLSERAECAELRIENKELKDDLRRLTQVLEDMTNKNKDK